MELVGAEWIITATNMNECHSIIEVNMDGISMAYTTPLLKFESFQVSLIPPQIIKFRNTTPCANGSVDWLTMDSKRSVDGINFGTSVLPIIKKPLCEKVPVSIHLPVIDDSVIATKPVLQGKMPY
tara:strand:+ start:321 stop:695 length:375 start_codon:yes stop_codon:yes gene_type:complete